MAEVQTVETLLWLLSLKVVRPRTKQGAGKIPERRHKHRAKVRATVSLPLEPATQMHLEEAASM